LNSFGRDTKGVREILKKVIVGLFMLVIMSSVALAVGSVELRATNNDNTKLTNFDYRVVYGVSLNDVDVKIDTLNVPFGTVCVLDSNIVDVTAKSSVLGLPIRGKIGPGQQMDSDGAIVNRNYNGLELSLPLGVTAGYNVLAAGIAGNALIDEASVLLPLKLGVTDVNVAVYGLRGIGSDILKAEANTTFGLGPVNLGLRAGVAQNANKIGLTASVLCLKFDYDTVTGTYTQLGEQIRTTDVLGLPIANGAQSLSAQAAVKLLKLDIVGTVVANSANTFANYTTLSDLTIGVDNLKLQYRGVSAGNAFVRVGVTVPM